jgi:hypothetical protein
MASTFKLKNNTGGSSKIGYLVKADPKNAGFFVYVDANPTDVFGVVQESVPNGQPCSVSTMGSSACSVYVSGTIVKGGGIRAAKTSEGKAMCLPIKQTDAPYYNIGTALTSGSNGLIQCLLNFYYVPTINTNIGSGTSILVQNTAPLSPKENDLWIDTSVL